MKIEYYKGGFVKGDEEMFLKPVVKIKDSRLSAFSKHNQNTFKSRYSSLNFLIFSNECIISIKDEYMKINDTVTNEMSEAIGEIVEMIENTDLNSLKEDYKKMNQRISSVVLANDPKAKIINRNVKE